MNDYQIRPVTKGEVEDLIHLHYLHRWPGVCVTRLGLFSGTRVIGTCVFALPPRESSKRYGVQVAWELARLFILDETPKNTETWFVARAIKWIQKNRPEVELLISYADPSVGHAGVIYKAGSWIPDGKTDEGRKTPRFDYAVGEKVYSRRGHVPEGAEIRRVPRVSKYRFIYWMREHEKKRKICKTQVLTTIRERGKTRD